MPKKKKKKSFASSWFCDSSRELNISLSLHFWHWSCLCLETDGIIFSKSSHYLASWYKKRDENVLLPWHRNAFELLKLPKLHLNCKYLYISLKFSSLFCLLRYLLLSWKMSFSKIMISETVLLSRSVHCWSICVF